MRTALQIQTWVKLLLLECPTKESCPWRLNTFPLAHSHPWEHFSFLNKLFVFLFISIYPAWNQVPSELILGSALLIVLTLTLWAHLFAIQLLVGCHCKRQDSLSSSSLALSSRYLARSPLAYPWYFSLKLTTALELPSKSTFKLFY